MLVGGKGTRLRPLTLSAPKPLLPTAGVPFLAHQLARAAECGITHVVLATSYRAEMFTEAFGTGAEFGLSIDYVYESEPLGTGGGIRNAAGLLRGGPDDPIVVLNGDVLSGHDLPAQVDLHRKKEAAVTLHLVPVDDPSRYGCVPTDASGRVTAFLEKTPNPVTNQINAGCYVFRRSVIDKIPAGQVVSVERETFPGLIAAGGGRHGLRRGRLLAGRRHARGVRPGLLRRRARRAALVGAELPARRVPGARGRQRGRPTRGFPAGQPSGAVRSSSPARSSRAA